MRTKLFFTRDNNWMKMVIKAAKLDELHVVDLYVYWFDYNLARGTIKIRR